MSTNSNLFDQIDELGPGMVSTLKQAQDQMGLTGTAAWSMSQELSKAFEEVSKLDPDLLSTMKQFEDLITLMTAEAQDMGKGVLGNMSGKIDLIGPSADTDKLKQQLIDAVVIPEDKWGEYIIAYKSFMLKRQAITDSYNEKIAATDDLGKKLGLKEEMNKVIADLEKESGPKIGAALGKIFGDMSSKSTAQLRGAARKGGQALKFIEKGQWDEKKGEKFGIREDTFNTLSRDPEQLKGAKEKIQEAKKAADSAEGSFRKMGNGFEKVFSSGGDKSKLKEGIGDIENGIKEATVTTQFLSKTFSGLGESFDSPGMAAIGESITMVTNAMSAASEGAKAGAMFGPIGAAAGAAIGVISSLAQAIAAIHDKKNEKRIQALQGQIETLGKGYNDLERKKSKQYSNEQAGSIQQQNDNLKQQQALINKQIAEEEDKKKTDQKRIKDWQAELDKINLTIEDNEAKMKDAIFGGDVQGAINDFAQAYANAWNAGDDKVKASKDLVKNMIKQMIMEAMKADIAPDMQKIRDRLAEAWDGDQIIDEGEQAKIEELAENLGKTLDSTFGWADRFLAGEKPEPERQGATKGIAAASQESIDLLSGMMTAVQGHTYSINESVKTMTGNSATILNHLAGIESNTGGSLSKLSSIESSLSGMKADINNLVVKGISIR